MPAPADAIAFVKALHDSYVARTGYPLRYNIYRENKWVEWCQWADWAWTEADLARVIGYLRGQIRIGKRNDGALAFRNLIESPDHFEEDLNLAMEAAKGTPSFQKKPARAKPATDGLVNAKGEAVLTGGNFFASLLAKPPPSYGDPADV